MKSRLIIIFAILIFSYFFIVVKGYMPVAFVGWQPIFRKNLDEQIAAYQKAFDAGVKIFPEFQDKKIQEESRNKVDPKRVLSKIIREEIVKIGIKDLKIKNLNQEVDKEISNSLKNESEDKLDKSLRTLYNWNIEEFKRFYLRPKTLERIVAFNLQRNGKNFSQWFFSLVEKVNVKIFIPSYHWDKKSAQVL